MYSYLTVTNEDEVDSPALLVYPELVAKNIAMAIAIAGGTAMLRPHVKTHKMVEVSRMLIDAGIGKFKCATIAEAEMLVMAGAKDILLAYQPTMVKAKRLAELARANPAVSFGYLVDNEDSGAMLAAELSFPNTFAWIDINVGMDRTGIQPDKVLALFQYCKRQSDRHPVGLHAYDGHIHDSDLKTRYSQATAIHACVMNLKSEILKDQGNNMHVVLGGTPCFPFYASKPGVESSPGTFVFWDDGYRKMFPDMNFDVAAILLTRIISIIDDRKICLDLGHKSVAPEGPLPRVFFPGHPDALVKGQSEEHLVVQVDDSNRYHVGDCWYGIPTHICPTVALYDSVQVVTDKQVEATWKVIARDRMITV